MENTGSSCTDGNSCQTEMEWIDGSPIDPNMFHYGLEGDGNECVYTNDDLVFKSGTCGFDRKVLCQFQCTGISQFYDYNSLNYCRDCPLHLARCSNPPTVQNGSTPDVNSTKVEVRVLR